MNNNDIYEYLTKVLKIKNVKVNESMKEHTTFKIGGNADFFIKIDDINSLKKVLNFAKEKNINTYIIGNGSNLLVKDNGIRGIVIKVCLDNLIIEKKEKECLVTVGAGVTLGYLSQKLLKENVSGFEFASGIPGTIGGAVKMNAGAYGGEFKDIVLSVTCLNEQFEIIELDVSKLNFEYRHSIFMEKNYVVLSVVLRLEVKSDNTEIKQLMKDNLYNRKLKQPINFPSAGSTFKRGEDFITAKLIDECGLKGFSIGDAQVSEKHAGFVINKGNATANDVLELVQYIKNKVKEEFGKELILEIEVIGE